MAQEFTLPDLGEGIHEAEIQEVLVSVGDDVTEDEVILTVETDKATTEVPSPVSGTIQKIHIERGELIEVGDLLFTFGETQGTTDQQEDKNEEEEADRRQNGAPKSQKKESAAEDKQAQKKQPTEGAASESSQSTSSRARPVPASPATRRLARELEVDLAQVDGSGPVGRVTRADVEAFAENGQDQPQDTPTAEKQTTKRPLTAAPDLPDFSQWGETERIPLRSIRRATARRMSQAWEQIPHVTHHEQVDVTELERVREEMAEELEVGLSLTPFVMKAAVAALKQFPRFNASLDTQSEEIVLKHYYHLGLAVDTERGLIVPVIQDVDRKSIAELAQEIDETAAQTRAGEIGRAELQGGTFTITNVGPLGGTSFTPIINYPQAAILGMAQATWRPVVRQPEGTIDPQLMEIEPRYILPIMLGFDHRLSDGADAARFCSLLMKLLEDPQRLLLKI